MTSHEDALLDSEEQEIEDRFESLPSLRGASIRRPVTLRMEETDLEAIRHLAEREGMPYQTLIGSVVHKYVSGALVDINEIRKVINIKA